MDKVLEKQLIEHYHRLIEDFELTPPFEARFSKDMTDEKLKQEIVELTNRFNKEYEEENQQTI